MVSATQRSRSASSRCVRAEVGRPVGRGAGQAVADRPKAAFHRMMEQRIRDASEEDLVHIKERMKQFGLDEQQIDDIVTRIRGEGSR